jgi:GntR family transcriptional repressor for pyruvate dehydrogenase complex
MEILAIKRHTLPDKIINQIRDIIVNGHLKPGDKLPPERELAKRFNVGRTTIREALGALYYTKIITRTREGTFININSFDYFTNAINAKLVAKYINLNDLIETRKLIEVKNASLAAQKATKEDIQIIRKNLSQMKKYINKNDIYGFINKNVKFHETIAEIGQNSVLYEIFIATEKLIRESQERLTKIPGIMISSFEEHKKICAAIEEGNACLAEEAMLDHLNNVNKAMISVELNIKNIHS